jgi:6-pyruvoyltetrahydropterin/6-carboxytetrahydropterin synthase
MLIYKEIYINTAHRLLNHRGKCKNVHGHDMRVQVWISGEKDKNTGLIVDFKEIEDIVQELDHSIVLNRQDELVQHIKTKMILIDGDPTCENISELLFTNLEVLKKKNPSIEIEKVRVWENSRSYAEFYKRKEDKYL